jgi:replication initiation and membrane attachment protein DnaB
MQEVISNASLIIKKEYEFVLDFNNLNNIYSPIVGNPAINLYSLLVSEAMNSYRIGPKYDLFKFLNKQALQHRDFTQMRSVLEAIGLIDTYYEDLDNTYYIVLKQPKTLREMLYDPKIKQLYINHIGNDEFEKLNFLYTNQGLVKTSALNISATIDILFNNPNDIPKIDYDHIYQQTTAHFSNPIKMSFECKNIIETQCLCLSTNEIVNLIVRSVVINEQNMPVVDKEYLNSNIDDLNRTFIKFNPNLKIIRNHQIFIKKASKEEIEAVFKSYHINSEQYLFSIKKQNLHQQEIELIKGLRKKMLDDAQINMITDFCYYKTGKYKPTYIKSTAQTVCDLNLDTCEKMLAHFDFSTHEEKIKYEKERSVAPTHLNKKIAK